MINKRLAAVLTISAMLFCAGLAKAADCECQAKGEVTATLADLCELTTNGGNLSAIINQSTGALDHALTPSFKLISSKPHSVEITANIVTTGGVENAFFERSSTRYLLLANTHSLRKPTPTDVSNAKAVIILQVNANVIAYPVSSVTASGATTGALTFSTDHYHINANSGTTAFTLTTGTTPRTNSFTTNDHPGQYKAEILISAAGI